jgi:putative Mg2+ transporter-C (MgtC) family protein
MGAMPVHIDATDIALRLALTVLAGLLIGYNRRERAKAAGLRTMLLVCLAASVSMIQVNLLMPTNGKPTDSYVTLDLMRLPLGILTGVGFIGGGAILRRGDIVIGVTTAATLWFVTVLGLCFGGGQIELGLVALVLGFVGLWGLELVEERLRAEHRSNLTVEMDGDGPGEESIQRQLVRAGLKSVSRQVTLSGRHRRITFVVSRRQRGSDVRSPEFLSEIARQPGVLRLEWKALA